MEHPGPQRAPIVVVMNNTKECKRLCRILERRDYRVEVIHSAGQFASRSMGWLDRVVLLDLNSFSLDNRYFKELKRKNPTLRILALSSRLFHPELEEALTHHIAFCLHKPVDEEELFYFLQSVSKKEQE